MIVGSARAPAPDMNGRGLSYGYVLSERSTSRIDVISADMSQRPAVALSVNVCDDLVGLCVDMARPDSADK